MPMSARTLLPFETFRRQLDEALSLSFAARALSQRWSGNTLEITGPGCRASATYHAGRFSGFYQLTGPAWLMRDRIRTDLVRMLVAAGCVEIHVG
jgi:hypothetical protein